MTTVQQVFDMAMHLMDEQAEATGATMTDDTTEYKYRTISILNTVIPSLFPFSDTFNVTSPIAGRPQIPALAAIDHSNPDFDQPVPLDDTLALGVLPYALAAHLTATENEDLSAWFMQRYNVAFADLRSRIPASFEPIPAPYGFF